MQRIEITGNWNTQKVKLKKQFPMLNDKDLIFAEGEKEEMLRKLQAKMGKTDEEFQKILSAL
jgi:uncharacterized protein YjbJ (UPF0337 family)